MPSFIFPLALLVILDVISLGQAQAVCGSVCTGRKCAQDPSFNRDLTAGNPLLLASARRPPPSSVCWHSSRGFIDILETGTALVYKGSRIGERPEPFVRIDKFGKGPKFPANYFVVRPIKRPFGRGRGIFRTKSGGKFEAATDGLCVKIPIRSFRQLSDGKIIQGAEIDEEDCFSFVAVVPEILVEVNWNSADDLDLKVNQPPGPRSGCKRVEDDNPRECNIRDNQDRDGKEQWRCLRSDKARKGTYRVVLKHFANCGDGPTKWNIIVSVRGRIRVRKSGTSNNASGKRITEFSFKYA